MNLRTLQYFLIAAEEENVTKAAERLYISQQALSIHIKNLEEEYGVKLFERKPVFRLTMEGRRMAAYARQMLGLEEDLRAEFSDMDLHAKGLLRVGLSRLRSNAFFFPIWEEYYRSHPNISIDLVDGYSQKFAGLLLTGKLDLYIALNVQENPACKTVFLYEERSVCIFRRDLLEQYYPEDAGKLLEDMKREGVSLPRISKLPFISTRTDNAIRINTEQMLPKGVNLSYILESNQQLLNCRMALKGYGACIVSPAALYMASKEYKGENYFGSDLCVFPLERSMGSYKCSLVYRRDWPLPSYAADFIAEVQNSFSEYEEFMKERFSL